MRNASLPESDRMQFRIGVNLGDVISKDNNCYGTGVNVAARLEQLAEPGGICISQTVYDQVRQIVEIPFQDIGEHRLKNITDPFTSIVSCRRPCHGTRGCCRNRKPA